LEFKEERNERIISEYLKAEMTQQEVADKFDVVLGTVQNIINNFTKNGTFAEIGNFKPFVYMAD
jgi:transposase